MKNHLQKEFDNLTSDKKASLDQNSHSSPLLALLASPTDPSQNANAQQQGAASNKQSTHSLPLILNIERVEDKPLLYITLSDNDGKTIDFRSCEKRGNREEDTRSFLAKCFDLLIHNSSDEWLSNLLDILEDQLNVAFYSEGKRM